MECDPKIHIQTNMVCGGGETHLEWNIWDSGHLIETVIVCPSLEDVLAIVESNRDKVREYRPGF